MSDKLTPKSDKCFFVGYLRETKGYYFCSQAEGKEFVARNGVFLEKNFPQKELVGARCNLKKFGMCLKRFQPPLNLHGMSKKLKNPLSKNQPHEGL